MFSSNTGQTEEVPAVKGGTTGFLPFCFFLWTLTAFCYNFNTSALGLAVPQRLQCVTVQLLCSKTDGGSDQWSMPSCSEVSLATTVSQWGCSSKCTSGRRLSSNVSFGNTDLPRFHSNQCHPHSKRHLCDRCVTGSRQRMTEAKPVCSEAPKPQEQLQSHPQAAELGHRAGAFTLH